jgi:predicted regulator of Ras-like GTPase activity (Roadblock/LC7/MglB family)
LSFETVLARFLEGPGAIGAAFLDPQGQTIAQAGAADAMEVLGAYQSVWLSEMARASRRAGIGELAELCLEFRDRRVVSAGVKDGYFVLVLLEPDGLVAPVRARLEEARQSLAQEI